MNKHIASVVGFVLSGLVLAIVSVSVSADHIKSEARTTEEVDAKLCSEVNQYHDWKLLHGQWFSETFNYQRYAWKAAKGYPVKDSKFYEQTDYDEYSDETLAQLAQGGDKVANLELALRNFYFRHASPGSVENLCYTAVVDGFSAMSRCMISSYGEKIIKRMAEDQGKSSVEQLQLRLKLLGWIEVSKDFNDIFAQQFAEILKPGYQRDDINQSMIEDSAQAIRSDINRAREERKNFKSTLAFDDAKEMPELWRYLEQNKLQEQAIGSCFQENLYANQ